MYVENRAAVTVCDSQQSVQKAIRILDESGYSLKNLSVLGRDCYGANDVSADQFGIDSHKKCAKSVSLWCKLWGMLSGDAFLNIDGIGSVLVVGPLAPQLIGRWAETETEEGLDLLNAGLNSLGVPQGSIEECEAALRSDRYVVVLCGNSDEVARAKDILQPAKGARPRQARRCPRSSRSIDISQTCDSITRLEAETPSK